MTKDHVPEDSEEMTRILSAGGKIKKLINENGEKIGPYRVWKQFKIGPGLAMSRSIGDSLAKELGIISDPIVTIKGLSIDEDLSIILASDGIWSIMDNDEVCNFVEFCRGMACKEVNRQRAGNVNIFNSCLAQALCEEARVRWLAVVEEDDVMIDDISCIIIEFPKMITERISYSQLKPQKNKLVTVVSPTINRKDMKRGSKLGDD